MNNMYDILGKLRLMEGKGSKPDFLDLDRDGNKTEPMKDAAKEVDEGSTGDYSAKKARAGKDIGKPGKQFAQIAKSAGERYGSKERGEKVAGAVLAKLRAKESVAENAGQLVPGKFYVIGSEYGRTKAVAGPFDDEGEAEIEKAEYSEGGRYNAAVAQWTGKDWNFDYMMEGSLDDARKRRLYDLIELYRDATDPNDYYDRDIEDSEEVIAMIGKEFGSKIADQVASGSYKMHFPRHGIQRSDPLGGNRPVDRITKAGKMYRQDMDYRKRNIKSRLGIDEQGVAEGQAPEIDELATNQYAQQIIKALRNQYGPYFDHRYNRDGSIQIWSKSKNINPNSVITPWYKEFRSKGWRFDQPVNGEFTIAVNKQQGVAEGNDGNLANNAKPYDKVTRGDVIAGRLGKDAMGGKAKSVKEGFNSPSLDAILDSHGKDVQKFKATGELSDNLYDALYGEWKSKMPPGIAEARTGDPYQWIAEALDINLLKAAQKHAAEKPQQRDPESERNIHKKYGYRSDRDDSDEDDYDEWGNLKPGARKKAAAHVVPGEKRGRGRPKGSGRAIGAKGPTGKSKLLARESDLEEDRDLEVDSGEFDREGDMAKEQLHTIESAAKELHDLLNDEQNLPEWVQSKITKAMDYIDTARDYMLSQDAEDAEEVVAEKAVSKAQRAAAGIAYAAKKGDIPKSELRGASREMAKMGTRELKKFAKTKETGLPEKKSKKEESVEETTVAGSVATAPAEASKGKKGMQFGKGVYENRIAESFDSKLKSVLTEGISINVSATEDGKKSLNVNATDEDAVKLAQILQLAGMPQGRDYHSVCPACGSADCQCDEVNEAELANAPDPVYGSTDMIKAQGEDLHKPKSTGQTTTPVISRDPARQGVMREADEKESNLWKLYKRVQ